MIKLKRTPPPPFWTRNRVKKWTAAWVGKAQTGAKWEWPQHENQSINIAACDALIAWHHKKCAFCESSLGEHREIEHFRSKEQHRWAAFVWRNLFLICRECNKNKGADDHQGCLKPDREDPADYLWINPTNRKIAPRPNISPEARERALKTIKLYKLDREGLQKEYEAYFLQMMLQGPGLEGLKFILRPPDDPRELIDQLFFHQAKLQALMDESQPYSLFIRSMFHWWQKVS